MWVDATQPPEPVPTKDTPNRETQTSGLDLPPPVKPTKPQKGPGGKRKTLKSSSSSLSDHTGTHRMGKEVKGEQQHQKWREEPPALERDAPPDPVLGAHVFVPNTNGVYPGL